MKLLIFVQIFFFYNKQLYFMKSICCYHIWSYKNTNLLNVCGVLFILDILYSISSLKLPSLFTVWLFRTFHSKSHNMKALVILSHSWSPFLSTYLFIWKQWTFVVIYAAFWSIFLRKNSFQITYPNHMTMTTNGQILSLP